MTSEQFTDYNFKPYLFISQSCADAVCMGTTFLYPDSYAGSYVSGIYKKGINISTTRQKRDNGMTSAKQFSIPLSRQTR